MPLIDCKVELKLKSTQHSVLSVFGTENVDSNSDNITFTIKDPKCYVHIVTFLAKNSQKLLNQMLTVKDLKYQCIEMNIKKKKKKL